MILEKTQEETGIFLVGDAFPRKHLTVRSTRIFNSSVRRWEANLQAKLNDANKKLNDAQEANLLLQAKYHDVRRELAVLRLKEMMNESGLQASAPVRKKLLEAVTVK
jgi:hypothetical protein